MAPLLNCVPGGSAIIPLLYLWIFSPYFSLADILYNNVLSDVTSTDKLKTFVDNYKNNIENRYDTILGDLKNFKKEWTHYLNLNLGIITSGENKWKKKKMLKKFWTKKNIKLVNVSLEPCMICMCRFFNFCGDKKRREIKLIFQNCLKCVWFDCLWNKSFVC